MSDFNTLFPNFLTQCAALNTALAPIAFVLFAVGIISSAISGQRSPSAYLRAIGQTCAYIAVLASLLTWSNTAATAIDNTVKNTLQADPAAVYSQYQKDLSLQKGNATSSQSWWDLLDAQSIFEGVLSCILWVLGWLASVIVFYAYLCQKFILYLAYGFAPLFVGFLAVRTLHSIGVSFLLGYAGVLCWPLGWGAASIVTKGLMDFMTDQSFIAVGGIGGASGYALQNLIGIAVLGVWLIFSTIAAPVLIQKAISTGTQVGNALIAGAASATGVAITSGVGAASAYNRPGLGGALAGVGAGGAAALVGMAEASSSGSAPLASAFTSLGHQLAASQRATPAISPAPPADSAAKPAAEPPSDPTGDKAAEEVLGPKPA